MGIFAVDLLGVNFHFDRRRKQRVPCCNLEFLVWS